MGDAGEGGSTEGERRQGEAKENVSWLTPDQTFPRVLPLVNDDFGRFHGIKVREEVVDTSSGILKPSYLAPKCRLQVKQ